MSDVQIKTLLTVPLSPGDEVKVGDFYTVEGGITGDTWINCRVISVDDTHFSIELNGCMENYITKNTL